MKNYQDPAEIAPPQKSAREYRVYPALIERCTELEPVTTAVAHPCDESSLTAAVEAAEADLIRPILVGPEAKIRAVAEQCGLDIRPYRLVDAPHSHASAAKAVEIVRTGEAEALMKGSLHTDELMAEVVRKDTGLRTERRISHVFIMDVPTYPKPLAVTDAAINIFPDLETKVDIVQNAIDMAHAFERERPKVAILSAVETVTPKIPSTIDAAALCKMAERGQITGALLDGPLAFDNAISKEAAADQGHPLRGRGRSRHPAGARSRGRQHAGQAALVPGQCRCRRHRARRARADHPDLARRYGAGAHGVLRGRRAARPRPPAAGGGAGRGVGGDGRCRSDHQRRLVQPQVLGLSGSARTTGRACRPRARSRASAPRRAWSPRTPKVGCWSSGAGPTIAARATPSSSA